MAMCHQMWLMKVILISLFLDFTPLWTIKMVFTTVARGVLLIVPRTLINGFLDKTAHEQSCDFLLQVFQKNLIENCLPSFWSLVNHIVLNNLFYGLAVFAVFPYVCKYTIIRDFRKSFWFYEMFLQFHSSLTNNPSRQGYNLLELCIISVSFTFLFRIGVSKRVKYKKGRFFFTFFRISVHLLLKRNAFRMVEMI